LNLRHDRVLPSFQPVSESHQVPRLVKSQLPHTFPTLSCMPQNQERRTLRSMTRWGSRITAVEHCRNSASVNPFRSQLSMP
jgi:hypothetical protein